MARDEIVFQRRFPERNYLSNRHEGEKQSERGGGGGSYGASARLVAIGEMRFAAVMFFAF